MEWFHSRGQEPGKFIGTKKVLTLEKSLAPTGMVWATNMTAVWLRWDPNMAAGTPCEFNTVCLSFLIRALQKEMLPIFTLYSKYFDMTVCSVMKASEIIFK